VKVVNLSMPTKKGSMSWTAKPKSTKKGDDSFETYSDIVLYKGGLPPIGSIARSRPLIPKPFVDALPSSKTNGSKRKTSPPAPFAIAERKVCYL